MKKSTKLLMTTLLISLGLAACGGNSTSTTANNQQSLTITTFGELATLDSADYDDVREYNPDGADSPDTISTPKEQKSYETVTPHRAEGGRGPGSTDAVGRPDSVPAADLRRRRCEPICADTHRPGRQLHWQLRRLLPGQREIFG